MTVMVKRSKNVIVSDKEFRERADEVERMIHANLAHHYGREEGLLVYDCLPMGNLYTLLHGNRGSGRTPFN
jgi:hypothetical protein